MAATTTKRGTIPSKMPRNYNLYQKIKTDYLRGRQITERDELARKFVDKNAIAIGNDKFINGNIYMFNYFTPKTEDELLYYDAMPCIILFGKFKTKKGEPRLLGFNIHYYPPRIRFRVLWKIMEIYKRVYRTNWSTGMKGDMQKIGFHELLNQLQKVKLEFGVREYDPQLIGKTEMVPPSMWHKAAYTEGHFRKQTRQAILNHWSNFKSKT